MDAPDADCITMPDGSCVAPRCRLHGSITPSKYGQALVGVDYLRHALKDMHVEGIDGHHYTGWEVFGQQLQQVERFVADHQCESVRRALR